MLENQKRKKIAYIKNNFLFTLNIHYKQKYVDITVEYMIHYRSIQELSTSHGDIHHESYLHQTPASDR